MFLTEVQSTEDLLVVGALEECGLVGLQQGQAGLGQGDGGGGGTHRACQVGRTLRPTAS